MSWQLGSDKSSLSSLQSTAFSLCPHMAETERWSEWASCLCFFFSSVQFSHSVVSDSATLDCSMRGFPVYHQLPGLSKPVMSIELVMPSKHLTFCHLLLLLPSILCIESVMPSNHLTFCHPLLLLPSIFPSIRVFANEAVLRIKWSKYCSFSFSIRPSNEYSGLI